MGCGASKGANPDVADAKPDAKPQPTNNEPTKPAADAAPEVKQVQPAASSRETIPSDVRPTASSKVLSDVLEADKLSTLVKKTHFDRKGVEHLYEVFKEISSSGDDDGLIDPTEFKGALGLKDTLFTDRIFQLFDENDDNNISFDEFICGLSTFCKTAPEEEKMQFSFKLYDTNQDGCISEAELRKMLEATISENKIVLSSEQVDELLLSTFKEANVTNGKMTLVQYQMLAGKHPAMLSNMTIKSLAAFSA